MKSTFAKAGLAALALLTTPFAAAAADQPMPVKGYYKSTPRSVVPYYSWTGFYVGINGGWGRSAVDWTFINSGNTASHTGTGWLAGGTVGYNYQIGSWVLGIEGDWDWASIKGSTSCPAAAFTCATTVTSLGTLRGRAGYAWNSLLLYGTAGWALANLKAETTGPFNFSQTGSMSGLAYGLGLEYAFLSNWTAKVEYLHADLSGKQFTVDTANTQANLKPSLDLVRVGLNYKFGGPIFSRF